MNAVTIGHNSQPKNTDWISVYRDLRSHPIVGFLNPDGTRRKGAVVCQSMAWIDLCMEANWRDRQENNNGQMVLVERGQLQGGRVWLADRWGWTENQVRWFLKKLQDDGMLMVERPKITAPSKKATMMNTGVTTNRTTSSAHFTNIITIRNYNTYQAAIELSDLLDNQSNHQSNHQSTTNQPPHSNNITREQEIPLLIPPGGNAKKPSRKRGEKMRLSPEWTPSPELRQRTKEKFGLNDAQIDKEAERFRRYWISPDAKNPMKSDWLATWENWIDRAIERGIHVNGHANGSAYAQNGSFKGGLY